MGENKNPSKMKDLNFGEETNNKDYESILAKIIDSVNNNKPPKPIEEKIIPKFISNKIHNDFRFAFNEDLCFKYENGYYKILPDREMNKLARTYLLEKNQSNYNLSEIRRGIYEYSACITVQSLKKSDLFVNCKNGLFNPVEEKMYSHTPNYFIPYQIQYEYEKDKECPIWRKFLNESLSEEQIYLLQEIIGYLLINVNFIKKFFILYGPKNCGKSVILNTIKKLIGPEYISNLSLQQICNPDLKFVTSHLYGKLINMCGDLPDKPLNDIGILKQLTGNDSIGAEVKGGKFFSYENTARLIFSCNNLPLSVGDRSEAFFERNLIIPFYNSIPADKQDIDLENKFDTSCVLSWAMIGLIRLCKNKFKFSIANENRSCLEEYKILNSTVLEFIKNYFEITNFKDDYIIAKDFRILYEKFCMENGYRAISTKKIKKEILENFPNVIYTENIATNTAHVRGYRGMREK